MDAPQMHSNANPAVSEPSDGKDSAPPCENCLQPFARKRRWQRFCSTACRNDWHRKDQMAPADRIADLERRVKALEDKAA